MGGGRGLRSVRIRPARGESALAGTGPGGSGWVHPPRRLFVDAGSRVAGRPHDLGNDLRHRCVRIGGTRTRTHAAGGSARCDQCVASPVPQCGRECRRGDRPRRPRSHANRTRFPERPVALDDAAPSRADGPRTGPHLGASVADLGRIRCCTFRPGSSLRLRARGAPPDRGTLARAPQPRDARHPR